MTLYDELVARGLIAQVTDEAEIRELINNGKATFYIGFDPTADSLHVLPGPLSLWAVVHAILQIVDVNVRQLHIPQRPEEPERSAVTVYRRLSGAMRWLPEIIQLLESGRFLGPLFLDFREIVQSFFFRFEPGL